MRGASPPAPRCLRRKSPSATGCSLDAAGRPLRRLARKSLIARRAAGTGAETQLIAANLDTLFIVSSCNADFNLARLERYLALARQAGVLPVVVLTRADACPDPAAFVDRARALGASLPIEAVNALDPGSVARLEALVRPGRDGGARRLVGRRQVDAGQRADRRGARHARHPRGRRARAAHHDGPQPAPHAVPAAG